jgi:hypothetical protein
MADYPDTYDQAHRFLGNIPFAPRTSGGGGAEYDIDQNQRKDDAGRHSGSREFDEGGGVASEVGGTRNYHHTGGATGGDLGNRPE